MYYCPQNFGKRPQKFRQQGKMSAPKKFKSALKKLCDRAKSALNSQARISSPVLTLICSVYAQILMFLTLNKSDTLKTDKNSAPHDSNYVLLTKVQKQKCPLLRITFFNFFFYKTQNTMQ